MEFIFSSLPSPMPYQETDRYDTFWRRFTAVIIDSIVLSPLTWINEYAERSANKFIVITGSLLLTTIYAAYFIIPHARYGQTVGKKIARIQVIDINERSLIGIKRSMIRESPWVIANIAIFLYLLITPLATQSHDLQSIMDKYLNLAAVTALTWMLIEWVTMLTNSKRRAAHDYLAGSVVIKTDS